jgi:hypothetical protein
MNPMGRGRHSIGRHRIGRHRIAPGTGLWTVFGRGRRAAAGLVRRRPVDRGRTVNE